MTIIGVDEAGRGPLAGSVVAAAVVLSDDFDTNLLADSKQLSAKKRDVLFELITQHCRWAVAEADVNTIDTINILQATLLAMKQAVESLAIPYCEVLVDGNQCPDITNARTIIKGDSSEPVISAASIIAKVWRDRQMDKLDKRYPQYGFKQHKGYGTKAHLHALQSLGAIDGIHRRSFSPVKKLAR